MAEEWVKWGIALGFAGLTAVIGYIMTAHNNLAKKQSEDTKALHSRIDDVKDKYVRRDDFGTFREETQKSFDKIDEKLDRVIAQTKH